MSNSDNSCALTGTIYSPFCAHETEYIKQKFLFTALCVAGKNAKQQQKKVDVFCKNVERWAGGRATPLLAILSSIPAAKLHAAIDRELKAVKMGQYTRLIAAVKHLCMWYSQDNDCFNTIEREALRLCPGMGMKTASFFLINTRVDVVHAVLDTHILSWLRNVRDYKTAPRSTPSDVYIYKMWEGVYFGEMFKEGYTTKDTAMFDLRLWKSGANIE